MSRRTSLPGAAELFRRTEHPAEPVTVAPLPQERRQLGALPDPVLSSPQAEAPPAAEPTPIARPEEFSAPGVTAATAGTSAPATTGTAPGARRAAGRRKVDPDAERRPTGRERHDEKITVYVSAEELMDVERARLTLRGEHGLAVDRGRIVREALAVVLADLEAHGEDSTLVRRLHGR